MQAGGERLAGVVIEDRDLELAAAGGIRGVGHCAADDGERGNRGATEAEAAVVEHSLYR
jgi:hypothetical protein